MNIQFANLTSLNLLWLVAALAGLMMFAAVLRRRALKKFATSNLVQQLTSGISGSKRTLKAILVIASLILLTVALTDPRWGQTWREVPQKGIDVMFAVDVSRSMLAEDATPSRLERARQQIGDMLDAMHGDRVGLVAFAGDVKQLSPLTTNYHDFKQTLAAIGPHSVSRGGSKLGDALKMAARGFLDQTDDHKAIVVFTDGDDQNSDPVDVAKQLYAERGIRVFTVGLGDPRQGARILLARTRSGQTQWLEHDGEQVWSKMNGTVLQQVAMAADGAWIPAETKQVDMAGVYRSYIANIEQMDFGTARIRSDTPRHQWFVGLALLLLVMESLLTDRRRPQSATKHRTASMEESESMRRVPSKSRKLSVSPAKLVASVLLIGIFSLGATSPLGADDASSLVDDANAAVSAGEYQTAIADYRQAAELKPDRWEPIYNEAVAQYRAGDLQAARQLFTRTLSSGDRQLEAQARFNLANCDYAEAVAMAEQDREAAITKLESAISHYRETLAANDVDTDARVNTELASRLIEQLRQEQKEQQQQDQQSEQNQDSQQQDQSHQSESQQDQSSESQDQQSAENKSEQNKSGEQSGDTSTHDQSPADSEQNKQEQSESNESPTDQHGDQQQDSESPSDKQDSAKQSDQESDKSQKTEQQQQNAQPQSQDAQAGEEQTDKQPEQPSGQASGGDGQQSSDQSATGAPQYGQSATGQADARPMTEIEADPAVAFRCDEERDGRFAIR